MNIYKIAQYVLTSIHYFYRT